MDRYKKLLEDEIDNLPVRQPANLYDPIRYLVSLEGKRIRPTLTLIGCHLFNDDLKSAIRPALGIEWFHNFTLMHDDIMDQAKYRRGKKTVHMKWNVETAILSGDAMLTQAYQWFDSLEGSLYKSVLRLFNQTAIEVCEGQQMDMDFENQTNISQNDYMEMIRLKTSVLLGASISIGARIGGSSESDINLLYNFGISLGLAFQLRDDYLDVFGSNSKTGKQQAGDIIENKKTLLYVFAIKNSDERTQKLIIDWYSKRPKDPTQKIKEVTDLFRQLNIPKLMKNEIEKHTSLSLSTLEKIKPKNKEVKTQLINLVRSMQIRTF